MAERSRLTIRAIERCTPKEGGPAFLWDGELRGFGMKVNPSGTKVFILQFRNEEKRLRRVEIRRLGPMTLEQARDEARIKLGEVAKGIDPAATKQASRNGLTVGQVCDWYLTEADAGRLLGRKHRPIKASTLYMDRSRVETHIRPLLGRRKVAALRLPDIEEMQTSIAAGKTAKPKGDGRGRATVGGKGAASRSVATLHSIFAHAKRHGLIDENPALGVRKFPDERRTRRLSREEIGELEEHPTAKFDFGKEKAPQALPPPVRSAEEDVDLGALVKRLNETTPLAADQADALRRAHLDRTIQKAIVRADEITGRREPSEIASHERGDLSILNQPEAEFRAELRSIDNDLSRQVSIVNEGFDNWFHHGLIVPPYYAWRVAIILAKAKRMDEEKAFLAAWCRHFEHVAGGRFTALVERAKKRGVGLKSEASGTVPGGRGHTGS